MADQWSERQAMLGTRLLDYALQMATNCTSMLYSLWLRLQETFNHCISTARLAHMALLTWQRWGGAATAAVPVDPAILGALILSQQAGVQLLGVALAWLGHGELDDQATQALALLHHSLQAAQHKTAMLTQPHAPGGGTTAAKARCQWLHSAQHLMGHGACKSLLEQVCPPGPGS